MTAPLRKSQSAPAREWWTARELAAAKLPGLPGTKRGVVKLAGRERWRQRVGDGSQPLARKRPGREGGGGWEYHVSLLPQAARVALEARSAPVSKPKAKIAALVAPPPAAGDIRRLILAEAARYAQARGLAQCRADRAFSEAFNARELPFEEALYQQQKRLSARTLQRWRSEGPGRKCARGKRRPLLETACGGEVATYIAAAITKQPHLSADHVRAMVRRKFGAQLDGKPLPSIRAFQAFISRWRADNQQLVLQLTDPDAFKSRARVAGGSRDGDVCRLNQLWEIDASPADVLTTEGRFSLYVCIDLYSRRIVALLSRTAKSDAVLALIRRAILAWGVPETIRSDNGADFTAHRVRLALASLGIEHDLCPPFSPEKKGVVERAIGTVQRDLMPLLPGFIGHNVADRKQIEARRAFAARLGERPDKALKVELSAADVQAHLDRWAGDRYAHRPHAGLKGKTPFEAATGYRGRVRAVEDERALDVLLAPVAGQDGKRTVGRQGVRVDGALFIAADVMPGAKVLVRCDPADMGRVWLFSEDGAEFLAEAICPERLGVDRAAAVAAARAEQQRMLREEAEPIRKAARRIKPADMIDAVLSGDDTAEKVVAFPRPRDGHQTDQLRAAAQSQVPREESAMRNHDLPPAAKQAHEKLKAEIAEQEELERRRAQRREKPEQRFARALDLERRMGRREPVDAEQARWLKGYQTTSEYRAHRRMLEDFGEDWLRAGEQ